jgi:retron-type reverse transcriptase
MHRKLLVKGQNCHVLDCDLKTFFNTVDHRKRMGKLRERIADPRLRAAA